MTQQLTILNGASTDLAAAAPAPDADGWSAASDPQAVQAMQASWRQARGAYERIEGAIAVLFPQLDAATDERYDGAIADQADRNLFDDEGFIGVHAIERILWSDAHPEAVLAFESSLTGYQAAGYPGSIDEASDFKDALAQRLIDDTLTMKSSFEPLALDAAAAFEGVVGSMAEQLEKTSLASTGEAESRYAQHTLADMRANLEGGFQIYDAFSLWIQDMGGSDVDAEVRVGFERVQEAYDAVAGDALPQVPASWNPDAPSESDLATEYGQLWLVLSEEADPEVPGSLVERMVAAGDVVGITVIP